MVKKINTFFKNTLAVVYIFAFTGVLSAAAYTIGVYKTNKEYQNDLIERGVAQYNKKTGNWEYITADTIAASGDLFPLPDNNLLVNEPKKTKK